MLFHHSVCMWFTSCRISSSDSIIVGSSSTSEVLAALNICCRGKNGLISHGKVSLSVMTLVTQFFN